MNSNATNAMNIQPSRHDNRIKKEKTQSLRDIVNTLTNIAQGLSGLSLRQELTFETSINNQRGPSLTIKKLSSLDPEVIIQWTKEVRNLLELNKPDNKMAMIIIKTLLEEELHYLIEDQTEPDLALDVLIKESFPSRNFNIYDRILRKVKANKYDSITSFYKEFLKYITMANACLENRDKLTRREIDSYFENALTNKQRINLLNIETSDIKKKVEYLFKLENVERKIKEEDGIDDYYNYSADKPNKSDTEKKLWCKIHRSR
ncbi:hypothetical protein H311_04653, partial [Anncaliia algerae PRA109]